MINRFWAVTKTYVYEVSVVEGKPCLEKVAMFTQSRAGLGIVHQDGAKLCVGRKLVTYLPPEGARTIGQTNPILWSFGTSAIVALFETEREARNCGGLSLVPHDRRWRAQTAKVLDGIGPEHPVFTFPDLKDLMLAE